MHLRKAFSSRNATPIAVTVRGVAPIAAYLASHPDDSAAPGVVTGVEMPLMVADFGTRVSPR